MKIPAIYLAAGQSTRMGRAKQSLELFPGMTLASMAIHVLLASGLSDIYIVIQPEDQLEWLAPEWVHNEALHIVPCHDAVLGMSYSLRYGLDAAIDESTPAVLVLLADQPFVKNTLITDLCSTFRSNPGIDYVASTTKTGILSPPVLLSRSMFVAIEQLQGDVGARKLLTSPKFQGLSICYDHTLLFDVDNPEDWVQAVNYYSSSY